MAEKKWVWFPIKPNLKAKIDEEDLERVSQYSWRATTGPTGRLRVVTSIRGPKGARSLTLGRFLMNPPEGMQVYPRRFNNGLDYRKDNLIVCTVQDRQRLLPKNRRESSSNYRGVSLSKRSGRWRAAIEVDGRTVNLGEFDSEEAAAKAYNVAAQKYFGPLAYQNQLGRFEDRRSVKSKKVKAG